MKRIGKFNLALSILLSALTIASARVERVLSVVSREELPRGGVLPTIAVDGLDRPHIMADRGAGRGFVNVFDRIGPANNPWVDASFDAYQTGYRSTQFFNPHLEIQNGIAYCSGIVFGGAVGMGTIVRSGMDTTTPTSPEVGYSVRRIQGAWDAGEGSIDLYNGNYPLSSGAGIFKVYRYSDETNLDGSLKYYGYLKPQAYAYGMMFAGAGGEKNAFWISKVLPRQHRVTGMHNVWHGAIGGYNRYDSSYQSSIRHELGLGPIAWADFDVYRKMEDDGTYVDVKSDRMDPEIAYITSDFVHDGGVCVNIYNPDTREMIFDIDNLLTVDADGRSGLRRYAPQMAAAINGGVWIVWTSGGSVYINYISATGELGTRYRIGTGAIANVCVDSKGYVHVVYSNGLLQYCKLEVTGATGAPITVAVDFDGDGSKDPTTYDPNTSTFYYFSTADRMEHEQRWGSPGDVPVPGNYDGGPEDNFAVFRPSTATWYIRPDGGGAPIEHQFGNPDDPLLPIPADYDGDNTTDCAVVNQDTYRWTIRRSDGTGNITKLHGIENDLPVTGNFDGENGNEIAIYRPSNYTWYWKSAISTDSGTKEFGYMGRIPAPADFNGDGADDWGTFDTGTDAWYIKPNGADPRMDQANFGNGTETIPVPADYDGDGTGDVAYVEADTGRWYVKKSSDGMLLSTPPVYFGWNAAGDQPIPGSYTTTAWSNHSNIAVYRPIDGTWYIRGINDGDAVTRETWGTIPSYPVIGDWDGDGTDDLAAIGREDYIWRIKPSGGGANITQQFGWINDIPVPGDYDGDTVTDFAVFRRATGDWFIKGSTAGRMYQQLGWSETLPVPGDYDGDDTTDTAVYRPATGNWYIKGSTAGRMDTQLGWNDTPVPADYDGDGTTDLATFRATDGRWVIKSSFDGTRMDTVLGQVGDTPVPGDYDFDGKADVAVYRQGAWHIKRSSDGKMMVARGAFIVGLPSDTVIGGREMPRY